VPKVELALYGLEYEDESHPAYRDHYIHMFLTFVMGSTILAKAIGQDKEGVVKAFIVDSEDAFPADDWPFDKRRYTAAERLLFLWTLAATFHDVGIPVDHLDKLRRGLGRYTAYFGLNLQPMQMEVDPGFAASVPYYVDLMSRIYAGGFEVDDVGNYKKDQTSAYARRMLEQELDRRGHGALSAMCLFRSVSREFMEDRKSYDLNIEKYEGWTRHVLENDIARAALAVALHSAPPDRYPKMYPLAFNERPLAWLLAVCDDLQEFHRPEGRPYPVTGKGRHLPKVDAQFKDGQLNLKVSILQSTAGMPTGSDLDQLRKYLRQAYNLDADPEGKTREKIVENALKAYWSRHINSLHEKVSVAAKHGALLNVTVHLLTDNSDVIDIYDH
jgi:hypothetical protein